MSNRRIVAIFDTDADTGQVDGQLVDVIAMQFVAGKTLDRLFGRKGLRLKRGSSLNATPALRYPDSFYNLGSIIWTNTPPSLGRVQPLVFALISMRGIAGCRVRRRFGVLTHLRIQMNRCLDRHTRA